MISRRNLILGVALVGLLTATGYTVWRPTDGGGEFVVSGVIEADDVHVGSKVGGRVLKVAAKEGQNVRAGDILVLLEPRELKASLAEAQASLRQAEARLFDFTEGTHPISTKGTTEIGGAKRRSDFESLRVIVPAACCAWDSPSLWDFDTPLLAAG